MAYFLKAKIESFSQILTKRFLLVSPLSGRTSDGTFDDDAAWILAKWLAMTGLEPASEYSAGLEPAMSRF